MLIVHTLNILNPLLPLWDQRNNGTVQMIVTAQSNRARGGIQVFRPDCLKKFGGIESVFQGVVHCLCQHLTNLAKMRSFDENVTKSFVSLTQGLNVVSKVFANFVYVEVISRNQRVSGTFVQPLRRISKFSLLFVSQIFRVFAS